jgi:predicted CoA-binding protein
MNPIEQPVPLLDSAAIADLLRNAKRIAIVGASSNPTRPSHDVMAALLRNGYECIPVNPNETEILGVAAVATLADAAARGHIDIVDVFRRPEQTEPIARDAVEIGAGALWLQLGVINWESARIAAEGGLEVVMDRCPAIELRRMGRA